MISREVEIKVKNGQAILREPIWCFYQDRGIRFLLTIKDSKFLIDGSLIPAGLSNAFASIRFLRPNSKKAFTIEAPIIDDKVVLTITQDLTDQLNEIGFYTCQVHLFDGDRSSRITIPEFNFEVKELIGEMYDPTAYIYYGRLLSSELPDPGIRHNKYFYRYNELTEDMILNGSNIKKVSPRELNRVSLGWTLQTEDIDDYSVEYFVVAVPAINNYDVWFDCGFGKYPFNEEDSGANGIPIKINGIDYLLYGQISTVSEQIFITVEEEKEIIENDPSLDNKNYVYYGRLSFEEVGRKVIPYTQLSDNMIKNGISMKKAKLNKLERTSLGKESECSEADYVVIAVPSSGNYIVTQDNGAGGKVPFNEDIAGANGQYNLYIDGIEYNLYGEVMPAAGEYFIYIDQR